MPDEFGTWISVSKRLPHVEKESGYWDSIPVIIAYGDGKVVGCFFSYRGGDLMDDEPRTPVPDFHTDEGLGYHDVTDWMPVPKHPRASRKG